MTKAGLDGKSTYKVSKREEVEGLFKIKSEDKDFAPSSIPPKPYSVKAGISGSRSEEIEASLKIKSEDAVLPPPGFPPNFNRVKAEILGIKDKDTVGKFFLDESNRISLPQDDAPRKNTLASANAETKAFFHGHGSSERSKRKRMESLSGNKSDKDAHVPPPPSFSPKHTRVEAGDSGVKDNETRVVVNNRTKGHDKSCSQTKNEAPGMGLEERICIIEKLCDWLKAGNCHLAEIS
ncbi:uncharacterized protein Fot_40463 [Forsythia ovata]|uniref:Uncharacterized protein n=1 Tax=Forsythia ovata TaxID=205694 RepID=A0ABD1S7J5_9LAMI